MRQARTTAPLIRKNGGGSRNRTDSPLPAKQLLPNRAIPPENWCRKRELNPRRPDLQAGALPSELFLRLTGVDHLSRRWWIVKESNLQET
jgi:hypothetical protein